MAQCRHRRRRRPDLFGGYVEAGWFLTGESRGYRGARWDRTRVRRSIEEGGFGAIQLDLRYDHLDLNSAAGPRAAPRTACRLGLTWIPTDYVRFLVNYARLSYDDARDPGRGRRPRLFASTWSAPAPSSISDRADCHKTVIEPSHKTRWTDPSPAAIIHRNSWRGM